MILRVCFSPPRVRVRRRIGRAAYRIASIAAFATWRRFVFLVRLTISVRPETAPARFFSGLAPSRRRASRNGSRRSARGSPPRLLSRRVSALAAARPWPGRRTGAFMAPAARESTARHTALSSVSCASPRSPPFPPRRRPPLHTHGCRRDLRDGRSRWHFHLSAFEVCALPFRRHGSPACDRWLPPLALHPARRHPRRRRGSRLPCERCSLCSCVALRMCCCCSRLPHCVGAVQVAYLVGLCVALRHVPRRSARSLAARPLRRQRPLPRRLVRCCSFRAAAVVLPSLHRCRCCCPLRHCGAASR